MEKEQLIILILFITIMLLLIVSFLLFVMVWYRRKSNRHILEKQNMQQAFNTEILQARLETQEHSFNQISRELHDNIGQLLSSTKMLMKVGFIQLNNVPESLTTAEQTITKAIQDLRHVSKSFNKEWLLQFNLIKNLETEINYINITKAIQADFLTDYDNLPLAADEQMMLFRVMQEALQNSLKHASPKHIGIQIKNEATSIHIIIKDDGNGFDFALAQQQSLGLTNMQQRIKFLEGIIEWQSQKNNGTTVKIILPLKDKIA